MLVITVLLSAKSAVARAFAGSPVCSLKELTPRNISRRFLMITFIFCSLVVVVVVDVPVRGCRSVSRIVSPSDPAGCRVPIASRLVNHDDEGGFTGVRWTFKVHLAKKFGKV